MKGADKIGKGSTKERGYEAEQSIANKLERRLVKVQKKGQWQLSGCMINLVHIFFHYFYTEHT